MLHRISSNLITFKTIEFRPGFNLVVAEGSMQRGGKSGNGTANSVGKTSVFFLIDFLLGGQATKADFKDERFDDVWFKLEASFGDKHFAVRRHAGQKLRNCVYVTGLGAMNYDDASICRISDCEERKISIKEWRLILGRIFFSVPDVVLNPLAKKPKIPTARELLGFFNRKSFSCITKSFSRQNAEAGNLICAYLMGLNWEYVANMIGIKKERDLIKCVREAAKFESDVRERMHAHSAASIKKIKKSIETLEKELKDYHVDDLFEPLMQQADALTKDLREAQHRMTNAHRRIALATQSKEGVEDDVDELKMFYESAKVKLGDAVVKELKDVQAFHSGICSLRSRILDQEIQQCRTEEAAALADIERINAARVACMQSDDVKGALGDFTEKQAQLDVLRRQYEEATRPEILNADADREEKRIDGLCGEFAHEECQRFDEYQKDISHLQQDFSKRVFDLYNDNEINPLLKVEFLDGTVTVGNKKPFTINIEASFQGDNGEGKKHMKVCVFDLLLFERCRRMHHKIDFLLHDSPAFESSDEGQIGALMVQAFEMTSATASQYVCAIDRTRLNEAKKKTPQLENLLSKAKEIVLSKGDPLYGFDY